MANFKHIFIVAHGRSGSTILQKQLNSIPGYDIKGENSFALFRAYQLYRNLATSQKTQERWSKENDQPWWGLADWEVEKLDQETVANIKKFILKPKPDCVVFGHKEIRYFDHIPLMRPFLHYLAKHFENAGFIFNFRDSKAVKDSGWWKEVDQSLLEAKLNSFKTEAAIFVSNNPSISHRIQYELLPEDKTIQELELFLGSNICRNTWHANLSNPLNH